MTSSDGSFNATCNQVVRHGLCATVLLHLIICVSINGRIRWHFIVVIVHLCISTSILVASWVPMACIMVDSLDLIVPSKDDYNALSAALGKLVGLYRRYRAAAPRDLLYLQHHHLLLLKFLLGS